jgi:hypothetical protein
MNKYYEADMNNYRPGAAYRHHRSMLPENTGEFTVQNQKYKLLCEKQKRR